MNTHTQTSSLCPVAVLAAEAAQLLEEWFACPAEEADRAADLIRRVEEAATAAEAIRPRSAAGAAFLAMLAAGRIETALTWIGAGRSSQVEAWAAPAIKMLANIAVCLCTTQESHLAAYYLTRSETAAISCQ